MALYKFEKSIYQHLPKIDREGYLEYLDSKKLLAYEKEEIARFDEIFNLLFDRYNFGVISREEYASWKIRLSKLNDTAQELGHDLICEILKSDREEIINSTIQLRKLRVGEDTNIKIKEESEILSEINYIYNYGLVLIERLLEMSFKNFNEEELVTAKHYLKSKEDNELKNKLKNLCKERLETISKIGILKQDIEVVLEDLFVEQAIKTINIKINYEKNKELNMISDEHLRMLKRCR